jgi:hypothetical protein
MEYDVEEPEKYFENILVGYEKFTVSFDFPFVNKIDHNLRV